MHEVVHALQATLSFRSVWMIHKATDNELALKILRIKLAKLEKNVGELFIGLRKGLDLRLKPFLKHVGDRLEQNPVIGRYMRPPFAMNISVQGLGVASPPSPRWANDFRLTMTA